MRKHEVNSLVVQPKKITNGIVKDLTADRSNSAAKTTSCTVVDCLTNRLHFVLVLKLKSLVKVFLMVSKKVMNGSNRSSIFPDYRWHVFG